MYHTEEKTLTKDNTTYVRYKRPLAKKLIQLGGFIELRIFKRFFHGGTSRKQCKKKNKQRTEKKKTHMYGIESLKTWGTGENIGKERT